MRNRNRVSAALQGEGDRRAVEGSKIYLRDELFPKKPDNRGKIYIFGKKCIISAFFLQLSAKKNNKDYIKTLDTEQNADYTIMDWVYWPFNASLSKYHQEEKT